MVFLSFEKSLPLFLALLTSFLNAVVLLMDLTGQDHDKDPFSMHSASRLCLCDCPEEPWRFRRWGVRPGREDLSEAGFDGREAELHPKRSFPVRREFVPPGFSQ